MSIHILPEHVISKIAAGEVIERPASVVKELVENALDAGANTVTVEAKNGGRRFIRVADDGAGISAAEVELAVARHATSKLQSADDLARIETLGFRGEALASIAAVSYLTLTTRSRDEAAGTTLRVQGGEIVEKNPAGAPAGTVITVENLFYNVPARLEFLKSEATERRRIDEVVTRCAMAYPAVRFILRQEGRESFRTAGTGDLGDVLVDGLGLDDVKQMLPVVPQQSRPDLPPVQVRGFTSAPQLNRARRSHITLFVNGRHTSDTRLTHAVVKAYHTLLPEGRAPIAVLMITLPAEQVDVNVHPTNAEVRFRHPDAVFAAVQRAVRAAVLDQAPAPSVRSGAFSAPDVWAAPPARKQRFDVSDAQPAMDLPGAEPGRFTDPTRDAPEPLDVPRRTLPMLRVVGQVGASYIIAEGPASVYLIDQHAAHERVLFERFMAQHEAGEQMVQHMLEGTAVELDRASAALLEEHMGSLAQIGFVLEPFGDRTYKVRAVPEILTGQDPAEALRLILADMESGNAPAEQTVEARMAARACKMGAIKAGQVLTHAEMQALIRQLERCANPKTCPHGRPTLVQITSEQLEKEFGRR